MDIPLDRCDPPLHGLYLSYAAGDALLRREDAAKRSCERQINALKGERDVAKAQAKAAESDLAWAAWGKASTGVAGVLVLIGVGLLVWGATRPVSAPSAAPLPAQALPPGDAP